MNSIVLYPFLSLVLPLSIQGLPPSIKSQYKSYILGNGLYNENDHVVILNSTNFAQKLFGKPNAWVVEFYNSWCGHCFAFAPTWKELAIDMLGWQSVVKLGAIDCAVEENTQICRDYDILGYPTLKFFSANAPNTDQGTILEKPPNVDQIRQAIVYMLRKEQVEGRGGGWPNISPYRGNDLHNLWHEVEFRNSSSISVFLIFEEPNQLTGTEVILDLSSVPDLEIRSVPSDNEVLFKELGVRVVPGVAYLVKNQPPEMLRPEASSREGIRRAIVAFSEVKGISIVLPKVNKTNLTRVKAVDMEEIMNLRQQLMELQKIKSKGDVVFLADLEAALRYMLLHEIPARRVIKGEALAALNELLAILSKYFPAGERGITYLQALRDEVFRHQDEIHGIRFKTLVRDTAGGLENTLATEDNWLGCRGSDSHLRGFPCGVWTLFHFLTVAALRDSEHAHFDPLQVLNSMLGYITHFFGCTPCSQHFREMAARSMRAKVTDASRSVLWLWSAHNEVNNRLKGGPTEDPEFPKVQYPSAELCPRCMDISGRWREDVVLAYLKGKYHQDALDFMGANNEMLPPQKHSTKREMRKLVGWEEEPEQRSSGRYFNFFDISIAVALYVASVVIILGVCWKFVLKRYLRDGCHHNNKSGWIPYHRKKVFIS